MDKCHEILEANSALILEGQHEEAPDEEVIYGGNELSIIEHVDHYVEEGLSNQRSY